jgi:predicted transcriptional regulator
MVVPETPLSDAIALMATQSKSVLVGSCSQLVGCFTKHDIVQLIASGTDLKTAKISEVMHTSVKTLKVSEFQEMSCALSLLCQQQLDLLPVVDNQDKVIGIITPESICQALAQEIEKTTDNNKQTEEQRRLLESAAVKNESEKIHECTEIDEDTTAFEELCESEQHFCIIADTVPMLICMSDSDILGNFFNQSWLEFTERTLEQKVGIGWWTQGVYSQDVQNDIVNIGSFKLKHRIFFQGQWSKYKWLHRRAIVPKDTTSKAGTGKLEYRPTSFDLVKYCQQLLEEIQMNLNNQRLISFTSQYESMPCCMDEKLLGHILNNLLSNAIKYSPDDSIVKFSLSCQNGQALFEIQDWGIGIPEKDLPFLFESFHRASNVGNILGTGLGMAIVKKCIEIHKGKIFVTSTVGLGTKFTVILSLNNKI